MATGPMVGGGQCNADGACTFIGRWNDQVSKEKGNARMTSKWTSPGIEVFTPGPDGTVSRMIEFTCTRR